MRFLRLVVPEVERTTEPAQRHHGQSCVSGWLGLVWNRLPGLHNLPGGPCRCWENRDESRSASFKEETSSGNRTLQHIFFKNAASQTCSPSRPKPKPGAPGLRQRDDVLLALCHSTLHNQPLTFIHSFCKYLSQVYYVSDPVLDTEVIQRRKSKDPFPIVGQDKE